MRKKTIKVEKTARYFQIGEFNNETKHVFIVLHGYAQLANYFLKWFKPIEQKENVIIAPEGLHRFYWNGFSGRVVASWMTKEDRQDDITDYIQFLDQIYSSLPQGNYKIHLIGFSQGAATALRWTTLGKVKLNSLSLWAGAFPEDINYFEESNLLNQLNLHLIIGNQDEFYDTDKVNLLKEKLNLHNINFKLIQFEGNHKVLPEPLIKLFVSLTKQHGTQG